jgi:hypothetical protein
MLLCIERGAVSADDTDPLLRERIDLELTDERRELRDGVGGSGFSNSLPNSLNSLSRPGCIWRAIMGKWLRRSLNDLTSFLRGIGAWSAPEGPGAAVCVAAISFLTSRVAGMMGVGSHVPMSGFEM